MSTVVGILVGLLLLAVLVFQVIRIVRNVRVLRAEKRATQVAVENENSEKGGE